MKHLVITNHRCGSSYFEKGIAKYSQTLNLREILSDGVDGEYMSLTSNRELKLNPEKRNRTHEDILDHAKNRRINNHFLKMMIKTRTPFTAKIHVEHIWMSDTNLVNELLNNSKTYLLYREDVEDSIMSKFFLLHGTDTPYESSKHLELIRYTLKTHEGLTTLYNTRSFDHVIKYEDLDPVDHVKNFQPYFDEPLTHLDSLPSKRMTKEEKIQTMINYEDFKRDFDRESPDYGFIK